MQRRAVLQVSLKVLSVLIVFGGLVRIVASRQTFQSFMIEELWVAHPYFIYIYRTLGAFIALIGITMFALSQDPIRYSRLLRLWSICFLFIGIAMFVAGLLLKMSLLHYAFDFVFCFVIAAILFSLGTQRVKD